MASLGGAFPWEWGRRLVLEFTWRSWDLRARSACLWHSVAVAAAFVLVFLLAVVLQSLLSLWRRRKIQTDAATRWQAVYGKEERKRCAQSSSSRSSLDNVSCSSAPSSGPTALSSPSAPSISLSRLESSSGCAAACSRLASDLALPASPQHVFIVVLGDLARSPRMIYHAQALSSCLVPPPIVHVVAYVQTPVPPSLSAYPYLIIHPLPPFLFESARRFFRGPLVLVFLFAKLLHQSAALASTLFALLACQKRGQGTRKTPSLVLVQSPPALPTVAVCGAACSCTGAKMLLDWHNLAYTLLLPLSRDTANGDQHGGTGWYRRWAVALASFIEGRSGGFASAALCVSQGMQRTLQKKWGLPSVVLYDRPNPQIRPITLAERHALAMKYMRLPQRTRKIGENEPRADCGEEQSRVCLTDKGGWRKEQGGNPAALEMEGEEEEEEGETLSVLLSEEEDMQNPELSVRAQQFFAFVDDCDEAGEGKIPLPSGKSRLVSEESLAEGNEESGRANCETAAASLSIPRTHLQSRCRVPLINRADLAPVAEPSWGRERTLITHARLVHSGLPAEENPACSDGAHSPTVSPKSGVKNACSYVEVAVRTKRPAVLLAATSWTGDEALDLLLTALRDYDRQREWQIRNAAKPFRAGFSRTGVSENPEVLPPLLVLISGRGPGKASWLQRARQAKMRHVAVRTLFAPLHDYYRLLAAVDVGISMHTSSSGVDLPMKIVDLKGAGVPVCAYEFPTIHELVRDAVDSLLFVSAEGLCAKLQQLLRDFPQAFDRAVSSQASRHCGGVQTGVGVLPEGKELPRVSGEAGLEGQNGALQTREASGDPLQDASRDLVARAAAGGGVLFQMRRLAESEKETSFIDEWRKVVLPVLRKLLE